MDTEVEVGGGFGIWQIASRGHQRHSHNANHFANTSPKPQTIVPMKVAIARSMFCVR